MDGEAAPEAAGNGRWSQSPPSAAQRARGTLTGGVAKKRGGRSKSGGKRRRAGVAQRYVLLSLGTNALATANSARCRTSGVRIADAWRYNGVASADAWRARRWRRRQAAEGGSAPPAASDGAAPPAPGSAQRHRRGRASRAHAHTPLARPTAPKNSSSFLMRCAMLGLNAPLFSPPQSTPHEGLGGGPSFALRWPAGPPEALEPGLGVAGPLAALLPGPALDPWGSNLDKIRRVDAPGAAMPAASAAGDDAAVDDAAADGLAVPVAMAGDGGEVLGFRFEERGPQYTAQLESENAALRARLLAAEAELQRLLRGGGEAEASAMA